MTDRITQFMYGATFGICVGMYLMLNVLAHKMPDNPSYTGKMQDRLEERLK